MANKPNNPNDFSLEIKDPAEKAFQRAIWRCENALIAGTNVRWIDIELPVNMSGNARSRCVDLIGIDDAGHYVIGEAKFGNSSSTDRPAKAVEQIMEYMDFIKQYAGDGHYDLGHHKKADARGGIDWASVASENTRLILVANTDYWDYWCKHREDPIPQGVECYAIPVDINQFRKQRQDCDAYTPEISADQNRWIPVSELYG